MSATNLRLANQNDHSYSVHSASICANEDSGPLTEQLDTIICQFLVEQHVPGATLAIAHHGHIVYEQGYGVAGAGRRMKANTALRVASISKPVTAIAVLRLCQEGRLSLDTTVFGASGILRQLKTRGDKRLSRVTVRHLLQHSAGWDRDQVGDAVFWRVGPPAGVKVTSRQYNSHLLQYVLNRRLQFTPGSRHAYSNLGYLVLGEVIEAVTGQTYESYVSSLLSLIGITTMYVGMEDRVHWQSDEGEYFNVKEPATAASIMPGQEDSSVLPQYGSFLMRNTGAYGGWVATARDVLTLLCSLESNKICSHDLPARDQHQTSVLDPSTVSCMLEPPPCESGRDWYGLGLDVQDWGKTWGHTGAMEGTCGTVQHHHSGVSWALLLNAWASDMDLDGVVKFALSSAQHLSPFPRDVAVMQGQMMAVRTACERQCILAHVCHEKLDLRISENKQRGYELVWVGVNSVDLKRGKDLTFNVIFHKAADLCEKRVLLAESSQLRAALRDFSVGGFYPDCVSSFLKGDDMFVMVILSKQEECSSIQEVDISIPANDYVRLLTKRRKCGFRVLSQSVVQCRQSEDLLVTAVMEKKSVGTECTEKTVTEDSGQQEAGHDEFHLVETEGCRPVETEGCQPVESEGCWPVETEGCQPVETEGCRPVESEGCRPVETDSCQPVETEGCRPVETEGCQPVESEGCWPVESEGCRLVETEGCQLVETEGCQLVETEGCQLVETEGCQLLETDSRQGVETEDSPWLKTESSQPLEAEDSQQINTGFVHHNVSRAGRKRKCSALLAEAQLPPTMFPSLVPTSVNNQTPSHVGSPTEENRSLLHVNHCLASNEVECSYATSTSSRPAAPPSCKRRRRRWTAGKVKTLSWVQMEINSFVAELGRQAKRQCGLRDVSFFPANGDWFASGVWSPASDRNCYHRMGVSRMGLLPALAEAAACDVQLRFLCQYEEDGVLYYALFWEGPLFRDSA